MKPEHFFTLQIPKQLHQTESLDLNLECWVKFSRLPRKVVLQHKSSQSSGGNEKCSMSNLYIHILKSLVPFIQILWAIILEYITSTYVIVPLKILSSFAGYKCCFSFIDNVFILLFFFLDMCILSAFSFDLYCFW